MRDDTESELPFIVAVGASAGGLEALTQMLEGGLGLTGMAVMVVQHLSSDYKSLMPELLARHTHMEVIHARHGIVPAPDSVYVIEPDTVLTFKDGVLNVEPAHKEHGRLFLPINACFESLAIARGDQCAVVVLSGTGTDGATGLRVAKSHGAVTVAQAFDTARFDGMPRAAMATGAVDLVLSPDQILPQLIQMRQEGQSQYFSAGAVHGELIITRVLTALRNHTGVDFSYYKPATIVRRVQRRMKQLGVEDVREYADRLFQDAVEARELHQSLLIGVTRFLRDEGAIDAVRRIAVPRLLSLPNGDPLRLWVPGCSTGEEAYSLAMLLQEGLDQIGSSRGFKLFATDVDTGALEKASQGEFSPEVAASLPDDLRGRYFVHRGGTFTVVKSLREKLLFSRHDVIQDPPFSHLDMVSCRNLLIYLKAAVQARVMKLLSTSLKDGGILWLGASEAVAEHIDDFETLDSRWRLYCARPGRKRPLLMLSARSPQIVENPRRATRRDPMRPLLEALQETYVPPCLVVDQQGRLTFRFGDLRPLLQLPEGAASLDVRDLLPDELGVLVSAILTRARDSGDVVYREMEVQTDVGPRRFDLRARLFTVPDQPPLVGLFFEGLREFATDPESIAPERVASETRSRVELLERELRQTRENLQATIEELESSNEELQATNEELIAANEELQSTNEELQSVNEELHTVNAEFSEKLSELTRLNQDLDNLFGSVDVGILLLDERLTIRRFNATAARYINVIAHDLGRPLSHLSHGLQYPGLLEDCGRALSAKIQIRRRVSATNGSQVLVQITGHEAESETLGVVMTLTDVSASEDAQRQLAQLAAAFEHSPASICVVNEEDRIIYANHTLEQRAGRASASLRNRSLFEIIPISERDRAREGLDRARHGRRWRGVVRGELPDGSVYFELVRAVPTNEDDPSVVRIGELLTQEFVPYDRLRRPDEPTSIGPLCYCLWSNFPEHRVIDERLTHLLDIPEASRFDPGDPSTFAAEDDAVALRGLFEQLDGEAARGYRFRPRVRGDSPARCLQMRAQPLLPDGSVQRVLVELAELNGGDAGPRLSA